MVKTFSEVFHQQTMDEDISAADAAQEDQVNAVFEEGIAICFSGLPNPEK